MRQPQKTVANKKSIWLIWFLVAIGIGLLISFLYVFYLYQAIQNERTTGFAETETLILNTTELVEIDLVEAYYGEHTYHIVFGGTENKEEKVVFLPITEDDQNPIIIDHSEIISEDEILQQLSKQCHKCQVKKINPAMIDDNPLWEITYRDENNRYVFDYFSIYDGSRFERLQFKQIFK